MARAAELHWLPVQPTNRSITVATMNSRKKNPVKATMAVCPMQLQVIYDRRCKDNRNT